MLQPEKIPIIVFTEKAIHAGKHVLLEKPICLSVEDGEKLLALDQSTELHILPGHILRYDASYNNAHRILQDAKKHGEIQSIRVKRNVPVERFLALQDASGLYGFWRMISIS